MGKLKNNIRKIRDKLVGRVNLSEEQVSQIIIGKIRVGGGTVGENVDILSSTIDLGEPYLIKIGNNVTLTGIRLLTHDASTKKCLGYSKTGKVYIGSDVFVGVGMIILPNVTIGSRVIIGAGSVVAKDIPDNSVVVGNPCRIIGSYDDYMNKNREKMRKVPVIDLLPVELISDEESKSALIEKGFGYVR